MKRFFFLTVMALTLCAQVFADTYHDVLVQYMQRGNVIDKGQYEQIMRPMIEQLFPNQADQAAAIFREYAASQLMTDIANIYEPAFRQYVTEQELNELLNMYSDPRYADIEARSKGILTNVQATEEYAVFLERFQAAAVAVTTGQPMPEDIPVPTNISAEYSALFYQFYYKSAKIDETLMGTFSSMTEMLTNVLRQQGVARPEEKVNALLQYANRNMPTTMMSLFHKILNAEELQLAIQAAERPAHTHAMEAVKQVSGNTTEVGISLFSSMANWLDIHYPAYSAPLRQLVDNIRATQM